jgi:hypothetical protein
MSGSVQRVTTSALLVHAGIGFGGHYVVASSLTPTKCVRDRVEVTDVVDRVDQVWPETC